MIFLHLSICRSARLFTEKLWTDFDKKVRDKAWRKEQFIGF